MDSKELTKMKATVASLFIFAFCGVAIAWIALSEREQCGTQQGAKP